MAEDVKGLNVKLGIDATEFKTGMSEVKSSLDSYKKDLSSINKLVSSQSDNIDNWRKKQDTLNNIIEQTTKQQQLLNQRLIKAKEELERGDLGVENYKKLERQLNNCTADLNKYNNELEKTNAKIKELGSVSVINFEKLGSSLSKVGSSLTTHLTLPLTAAATALVGLTASLATNIDELNDTASKAGLNVEQYQQWAYAAEILAVDSNQLYKAFVKVNALLGDIASGRANSATEALASIGVAVEDLQGLDTEGAFELIRNALSQLEDQALRTDIANQIFGDRLGSELAQVLGATSERVEELKEEADSLGLATQEQADLAGDFNDELLRLKMSFQGVGYEIMEQMMPALQSLSEYVRANLTPAIQTLIDAWNNLGADGQKNVGIIAGVVVGLGPAIKILGALSTAVGVARVAFSGLGTSISSVVTALGPIGIAIGAVAAVLAYCYTQSETMRESINGLFESLMAVIEPLMQIVQIAINALMPVFESLIQTVGKLFNALMPLIDTALAPLKSILNFIGNILDALMPVFEVIINSIIKVNPLLEVLLKLLEPVLNFINKISEGLMTISNWFIDLANNSFIGDFLRLFGIDLGTLKLETGSSSTSNYNNNVSVYTSSSTFDVDSINQALGGKMI